eukprot:scaffold205225_cov33-Tisochrysis_lutea.AAC.1
MRTFSTRKHRRKHNQEQQKQLPQRAISPQPRACLLYAAAKPAPFETRQLAQKSSQTGIHATKARKRAQATAHPPSGCAACPQSGPALCRSAGARASPRPRMQHYPWQQPCLRDKKCIQNKSSMAFCLYAPGSGCLS